MSVHDFFSHWEIYRLCIEHNTLHHRQVGAILASELTACTEPFSFLDLACGDAETTVAALRGTAVRKYTGVDFSRAALGLARVNTASLGCAPNFEEEDYVRFLSGNKEAFDIVYVGLSLHHLPVEGKRRIMPLLRRATSRALYVYEPVLRGGETREACLERWKRAMAGPYDAFPAPARSALWEHVRTFDYPETAEEYISSARAAGFSRADVLFTDTDGFYSLFRFMP